MNLLWFLGAQLVLINPYIAWFAGRGAVAAWGPAKAGQAGTGPAVDLALPLNTSLPFVAYLLLHGLHDRVEAHWPAPLYPALAILAACAAETVAAKGYLSGFRRRAAPVGLVISALVLAHLALPATDVGPGDLAQAFRGWPDLARRIEAARVAHHAAWVGTLSYATTAQLAASGRIHAPIIELRERDRYPPGDPSWRADLSRPGLVVDLTRRIADAKLGRCFASITPLPAQIRGDPGKPGEGYGVVLANGSAPPSGDCQPRTGVGSSLGSGLSE
jgi:hypothetical protein